VRCGGDYGIAKRLDNFVEKLAIVARHVVPAELGAEIWLEQNEKRRRGKSDTPAPPHFK